MYEFLKFFISVVQVTFFFSNFKVLFFSMAKVEYKSFVIAFMFFPQNKTKLDDGCRLGPVIDQINTAFCLRWGQEFLVISVGRS